MSKNYTLLELAEKSGVSARTIRYYIAEGMLPRPPMGPTAFYMEDHLDLLRRIQEGKAKGWSLSQIKTDLFPITPSIPTVFPPLPNKTPPLLPPSIPKVWEVPPPPTPTLQVWEETVLGEDVKVGVRVDATPRRKRAVAQAVAGLAKALEDADQKEER